MYSYLFQIWVSRNFYAVWIQGMNHLYGIYVVTEQWTIDKLLKTNYPLATQEIVGRKLRQSKSQKDAISPISTLCAKLSLTKLIVFNRKSESIETAII